MKRDLVVKLIASTLTKYNNNHPSYNETQHASEVLKIVESLGIVKPKHRIKITRRDIEGMPYEDEIEVDGWSKE